MRVTVRLFAKLRDLTGAGELIREVPEPATAHVVWNALLELEPLVQKFREYKSVRQDMTGAEELVNGADAEMRELAREELKALQVKHDALLQELKVLLIPKDPNDEKNVILEIRAGTGGDEAALFAADLVRIYSPHPERQGRKIDVMSTSESGTGGVEVSIGFIERGGGCNRLKYQNGVDRGRP